MYEVQVGAFLEIEQAQEMMEQLQAPILPSISRHAMVHSGVITGCASAPSRPAGRHTKSPKL